MAIVSDVKITDNSKAVLDAAKEQINAWLQAIGEDAAGTAADKAPHDTGRLGNSINWAIKDDYGTGDDAPKANPEEGAVYIGTNVEYAPYVELGHHTVCGSYVAPKAFLRPAVENHKEEYRRIVEMELGR